MSTARICGDCKTLVPLSLKTASTRAPGLLETVQSAVEILLKLASSTELLVEVVVPVVDVVPVVVVGVVPVVVVPVVEPVDATP